MTDVDSSSCKAIVRFQPQSDHIYNFDALQLLELLPDESVNCIITSPPCYGLRDYGVAGRLDEYLARRRGEAYSAYMFDDAFQSVEVAS